MTRPKQKLKRLQINDIENWSENWSEKKLTFHHAKVVCQDSIKLIMGGYVCAHTLY